MKGVNALFSHNGGLLSARLTWRTTVGLTLLNHRARPQRTISYLAREVYNEIMNNRAAKLMVVLAFSGVTFYAQASSSGSVSQWMGAQWDQAVTSVQDTWRDGDVELYVPVLSYHMRFNYDQELLDGYNEFPAGIGLGKGRYNASGNWEGMYAMGFLDSHSKPTFMAGYAWVPTWRLSNSGVKLGVGVTGFLMSRSNYLNGIPFPGVLPVASISYKSLAVQASYIPSRRRNDGNVLFVWGKWTFH